MSERFKAANAQSEEDKKIFLALAYNHMANRPQEPIDLVDWSNQTGISISRLRGFHTWHGKKLHLPPLIPRQEVPVPMNTKREEVVKTLIEERDTPQVTFTEIATKLRMKAGPLNGILARLDKKNQIPYRPSPHEDIKIRRGVIEAEAAHLTAKGYTPVDTFNIVRGAAIALDKEVLIVNGPITRPEHPTRRTFIEGAQRALRQGTPLDISEVAAKAGVGENRIRQVYKEYEKVGLPLPQKGSTV